MAVLLLSVSTARPQSYIQSNFETPGGKQAIAQRISDFIERILSGNEGAMSSSIPPQIAVSCQESMVPATGTVTFSAVATAADTVLINGVTFTAVSGTSGATGNNWNVGTTEVTSAAGLAAAVNRSVSALVTGFVTALSASGVTTIFSSFYGTVGNQATLAEGVDSGTVMTVTGPRLQGGANDSSALTLQF